jgi:hypothetical protein
MLVNRFWNESVTPQGASATLTGATRDVGVQSGQNHSLCAFNAIVVSDQAGTIRIETSLNGSTWYRATADVAVGVNTPVVLSVPVASQFHRAVYVNGATAQGSFKLDTSYTES